MIEVSEVERIAQMAQGAAETQSVQCMRAVERELRALVHAHRGTVDEATQAAVRREYVRCGSVRVAAAMAGVSLPVAEAIIRGQLEIAR